jgi:hypothetical protein
MRSTLVLVLQLALILGTILIAAPPAGGEGLP